MIEAKKVITGEMIGKENTRGESKIHKPLMQVLV